MTDLIGLPYKVRGRDETGLDCFGLIWLISKRNGTPIKDPVYKGFDPTLIKLAHYLGFKQLEDFKVNCVLEIENNGRLHLGYSIDDKRMIHCTSNQGVVVEDINKYEVKGYWTWA